jgi:hypothetical protein
MNKPLLSAAAAAIIVFGSTAFANEAELERRLQKLEEAIARIEARLAKLESARSDNRRGGMMGGGMMGGSRPNEQWRSPEATK